MAWNWAKEIPWDIFRWEGNKQWRRRQSSQCDDARDDARASRRTEAQKSRLGRWRQCAQESKKNSSLFILITSKITSCMSNAFPKSIICRARLWRPEKKFFFKSWKILPRMSIEDSCLEGRWPGSCPVSGRRGSGPSSAIDAQVPKSEKNDIAERGTNKMFGIPRLWGEGQEVRR